MFSGFCVRLTAIRTPTPVPQLQIFPDDNAEEDPIFGSIKGGQMFQYSQEKLIRLLASVRQITTENEFLIT